jgi:uncharacterized membrane-anchored protein
MFDWMRRGFAVLMLLASSLGALAQTPAQQAAIEAEQKAAFEAARKAQVPGPAEVKLADQATLKVPEGYIFVPKAEAGQLLRAMGNTPGDSLLGAVFPQGDEPWFAVVRYINEGHIKDDEAKDWNADDLLKSLREGTDAANEERAKRGIREMEIVGWAEKPSYDAATHRLVWSASTREKGTTGNDGLGVNYNTYALGREGYMSLNLVTDLSQLPKYKASALTLLGAMQFNAGRKYADFNSSTDKVAEYGIAALVAGVAAKKLGLFALMFAFAAKFAKVLIAAAAAAVYGIRKFFGGKKDTPAA